MDIENFKVSLSCLNIYSFFNMFNILYISKYNYSKSYYSK